MLRRERVVERQDRDAARPRDVRGELPVRLDRSGEEAASVDVEHEPIARGGRGADDLGADSAERERLRRHAGKRRSRRQQDAFLFPHPGDRLSGKAVPRENPPDRRKSFLRRSRHSLPPPLQNFSSILILHILESSLRSS